MTGTNGHHHRRNSNEIPDRHRNPLKYLWFVVRWRGAVAVAQYPVQIALAVAIAVCGVPVWMVVQNNATVKSVVANTHKGRVASSRVFCSSMNDTIAGVNAEAVYLKGLIQQSVKQSKVFEPLYRQYGVTPEQRKKQVKDALAGLDKLRVAPLNCKGIVRKIESEGEK